MQMSHNSAVKWVGNHTHFILTATHIYKLDITHTFMHLWQLEGFSHLDVWRGLSFLNLQLLLQTTELLRGYVAIV